VQVLQRVVNGPELIEAADLVVGGGGTMNREAAVLGVPVWSVFNGPVPAIDEQLAREGRLRWIRSDTQVREALAAAVPPRLPRRGPYRDGLMTIMNDLRDRLGG
jgi:predicted glycosyltransferase